MTTTIDPGAGALEFALTIVGEEITLARVEPLVKKLVAGEAHDPTDRKVKRCDYCGYYFRDKTRPNNSVVCSVGCRKLRKALYARNEYVPTPPKPRPLALDLEYPFYKDTKTMQAFSRNESIKSPHIIANIQAARLRHERIGGKRRKREIIQYNGDELSQRRFNVKIVPHNRKAGEVFISEMTREEFYQDKYTAERLAQERWRAKDNESERYQYQK